VLPAEQYRTAICAGSRWGAGIVLAGACLAGFAAPASAGTPCTGGPATSVATPVTYTGRLVTDVSLDGRLYRDAEVTLKFRASTADVRTFSVTVPVDPGVSSNQGSGHCIDVGVASVQISTPQAAASATFAPGQILVTFDEYNSGIGFSSYTGPHGFEPAYPLGLLDGTVYTTPIRDLYTGQSVTGKAWSCIGYPPLATTNPYGSRCGDPGAFPLKTDHGDFIIYQPFSNLNSDGTLCCNYGGTLNRGVFTVRTGAAAD